jgi:hypothetical protein
MRSCAIVSLVKQIHCVVFYSSIPNGLTMYTLYIHIYVDGRLMTKILKKIERIGCRWHAKFESS